MCTHKKSYPLTSKKIHLNQVDQIQGQVQRYPIITETTQYTDPFPRIMPTVLNNE